MKQQLVVNDIFLKKLKMGNIFQARSGMIKGSQYQYINRLRSGDKVFFTRDTCIEEYVTFAAGCNLCSVGSFSSLASTIPVGSVIGRYVSLAKGLKSMGFRHPVNAVCMNSAVFNFYRENIASYFNHYEKDNGFIHKKEVNTPQPQKGPITIGNDVWIGENVTINGGISIGDGAVIASGSVITKNVSPYSIIAGIPGKHRKYRFPEEIISGLLEINWWNYELGDLFREGVDFSEPANFLKKFILIRNNLRSLSVDRLYPILLSYDVEIQDNKENFIFDWQGYILYWDHENNKVIKSFQYLKNFIPVSLLNDEFGMKGLFVKGLGYLQISFNDKNKVCFSIIKQKNSLVYNVLFNNKSEFYIQHKNEYLCSTKSKDHFMKVSHIKEWEYFYFYD